MLNQGVATVQPLSLSPSRKEAKLHLEVLRFESWGENLREEKGASLCGWTASGQKKLPGIAEKEQASVCQASLSSGCLCLLLNKAVFLHPGQPVTFAFVSD